jgi:hypothetical protein
MVEMQREMAAMGQETTQRCMARKAAYNAPRVLGVITLAGGKRLEFQSHFTYFNARAFYSKLGAIVSAMRTPHFGGEMVETCPPMVAGHKKNRSRAA